MIKKILSMFIGVSVLLTPFSSVHKALAVTPTFDVTGNYVINMNYLGTDYAHDMSLVQNGSGNLTGNGGSPSGSNVYTWVLTSGTVAGNSIDFLANYTATPDAVTPQTVMHITGIIAPNGTMSGTWSDNYSGGARTGSWVSISGNAAPLGTLSAEDFGVVNYDTGLGMLKGYTAGFGLTNATFAGATSVVVKLYSTGNVLLQTNTAILSKFNTDITGNQFSSPFDVSGNFAYATDGYWTNVKESQYGQSVPATKVVATATLANGKIVTATNTNLAGDPTTIYPPTTPATSTVHIFKYIDGVQATTVNANNAVFPMFTSTYNAPFTLGPGGWTTGDIDYEASTSPMALGSSYSANEILNTPLVGATCDANHTYSLAGYGVGNTLSGAIAATPSLTTPSFTNLQSDKYIIVRNITCATDTTTTGTISGMKYNDLNRNGRKDVNEPGLAGWVIKLKTGGDVVTTTTTGTDGKYIFNNIAPGKYKVRETQKNGWKRMSKNPKAIVIVSGSIVTDVNFGNAKKYRNEREDTQRDCDRDEQSGSYYAKRGKSNYEKDYNKNDHRNR